MDSPRSITIPLGAAQLTVPVAILVRTFLKQYAIDTGDQARLAELSNDRPAIGSRGLHGIYAGIARGVNGAPDHILEVILDTGSAGSRTWADAKIWAESIGGELPTRKEAALLFANVPELFEQAYYWTSEQSESDSSYAWCQSFYDGGQDYYRQTAQLRARAVRRLPLSVI